MGVCIFAALAAITDWFAPPKIGVLCRRMTDWGEFSIVRTRNDHDLEPFTEVLWLREYGGRQYDWCLDVTSYGFFSSAFISPATDGTIKIEVFPSTWTMHRTTNGWSLVDGSGRSFPGVETPDYRMPTNIPPLMSRTEAEQ